jgi:DNA-binding beta-propeller fold protein YncE
LGVTLHNPVGVAVDATGNVFFTDFGSLESSDAGVYEVANGLLTAAAGNFTGLDLRPGDGAGATSVLLLSPAGIAAGAGGAVYFADSGYGRVRVLNLAGTPPPSAILPGGVLNAASFAPAPVAPGSIATLYGSFGLLSPSQASDVPLPSALSGLSIQFQSGFGVSPRCRSAPY